jgi:hypothetical protein
VPAIRVNPLPQIVFVPTWIWLGSESWGRRSATASVPGMSVTATATPVRLVVSTGDGAGVTCTGPGMSWTAGSGAACSSPTCGYTYARAGSFPLQAVVTWVGRRRTERNGAADDDHRVADPAGGRGAGTQRQPDGVSCDGDLDARDAAGPHRWPGQCSAGRPGIAAAQMSTVVGRVAAVPLVAGTLLSPAQFGGPAWPEEVGLLVVAAGGDFARRRTFDDHACVELGE